MFKLIDKHINQSINQTKRILSYFSKCLDCLIEIFSFFNLFNPGVTNSFRLYFPFYALTYCGYYSKTKV